jgi:hydroxyethylthiazole kinase-like uncharacterized protein yjeF
LLGRKAAREPLDSVEPAAVGLSEETLLTIALENCSRSAAMQVAELVMEASDSPRPLVLAGSGLEGAAALGAARHLFNWGLDPIVKVIGMRERMLVRTGQQLELLSRFGCSYRELHSQQQAAILFEECGRQTAVVLGETGEEDSLRSTEIPEMARKKFAAIDRLILVEPSIRYRSQPPEEGGVLVTLEAEARDRETIRLLDSTAVKEYGMPSLALMENAGFWAARFFWERIADLQNSKIAIIAGRGNNGGDGFVIARHLAWWGADNLTVYLLGGAEGLADDAQTNYEFLDAPGVKVVPLLSSEDIADAATEICSAQVLIDSLLGTGLNGKVRDNCAHLLEVCAGSRGQILAVDTPSGLDASSGQLHGPVLQAEMTVTFGVPKTGFMQAARPQVIGELVVADISLPAKISGASPCFSKSNS